MPGGRPREWPWVAVSPGWGPGEELDVDPARELGRCAPCGPYWPTLLGTLGMLPSLPRVRQSSLVPLVNKIALLSRPTRELVVLYSFFSLPP